MRMIPCLTVATLFMAIATATSGCDEHEGDDGIDDSHPWASNGSPGLTAPQSPDCGVRSAK
jgi:hypothetical protein